MSPTIISSPPNMPSSTLNIAPNPAQVSSSATPASTATPASIPSRRRSSILTSTTAAPLIANTTVNPLASFLSNGTFRLPSAVAVVPTTGTSRRTSSGVSNRRISSSSSDAGGSSDALIDLTGSISSINRRSNLNLAAVAAGSGVSSSGPDGAIGEESGAAPSSTRQWNNLSSVVQSISPLLPSSVLFQRAARRVMGSQNMGRLSGNRRGAATSGTLTSSNSVDSGTMERDDLLTLLSAMEEGVSDEPRTGTVSSNKNTSNVNTTGLFNVKTAQTPATIGTSNANGGSITNDSDSEAAPTTICGTAGTSGNKVEPLKTLSVSNLNTCGNNNEKNVVDSGSAQLTGAIPKTRQDSGCVIVDIGSSDTTGTGNECGDVSSNRSLFGNLFSSLTGTKEDDSVQQTKHSVTNSTTDATCKSKNSADASQSVAVDIEGDEKSCAANKEDKSKGSGSDDSGNTKALTSNTNGGEGRDSNGGEDVGGDATNNNNTNENETNGNEETEENNDEEEETAENTPEDPYWTSVLWQLPVLLGMMLGKYLQYYFFDILAMLSVAGLFHIFNIVVKRNIVSNRQITLGWQQCCVKTIQNWKKKLTCRRRQMMTGRWGGIRGTHQNNAMNADGGANGALGGASEPVGEASGPVGVTIVGGGGVNNLSDVSTGAATAVAISNSTSNGENTRNAEAAGVQTMAATSVSSTKDASKADSTSAATQAATTNTTTMTAATTSVTSTTASSVMDDWWGRIKHMTIGSTSSEAVGAASTPRPSTSAVPTSTALGTTPITTTISTTSQATGGIVSTITTTTVPATEGVTSTAATNTTTISSEGAASASASTSNEAPVTAAPVPPPLESEVSLDSVLSLSEEDQQAQESVECVQERAQLLLLTFVAAPLVAFLFYGGLWRDEELWRSLGFLSPAVPPVVLTHVLWLCLAVDYLARLCTVWLKAFLCLALLCRSGASVLSKGKYYPLLEMLSQLYRCLLPVHPWFLYLCNYNEYYASADALGVSRSEEGPLVGGSEDEGVFLSTTTASPFRDRSTPSSYQFWGIALFIVYLLNKKVDVATNAVNLWQAFKALRANTGSYGTAPSKSEIENSGGKCPICHDPFKGPTLLTCSHIFCEGCIVQWFQRERICPMCRAQIADDPLWKDGATSQLPQII